MSISETTDGAASPAPSGRPPQPPTRGKQLGAFFGSRQVEASTTFFVFVVLFAGYAIWLGDRFMNSNARLLDIHQNVPLLLLALAAMVTLITGVFDLSIASMAALTAFLVVGLPTQDGVPFAVAVILCLLIGVAGGLINGLLVEALRVNPFIVTLGTGGIFLGISTVYGKGGYVIPGQDGRETLPQWFIKLGQFGNKCPSWLLIIGAVLVAVLLISALGRVKPRSLDARQWLAARVAIVGALALILIFALDARSTVQNISWLIGVLVVATTAMWLLMQYTTYGRYLKATGGNRNAARLAGVKVQRETIRSFVISGLLGALAGIAIASIQGSAAPQVGTSLLLPAFAAAFVSTVVFSTGQFTVWGTIVGGIFIVWVSQGLIIGGLAVTWTGVVNGAVLVSVVAISRVLRLRR